MDAVQNIRTYNQKADISDQLEQAQSRFEQEETVDQLVKVAQMNAFDEQSTLAAIATLQNQKYDTNKLYDLLLDATQINTKVLYYLKHISIRRKTPSFDLCRHSFRTFIKYGRL